MKKARKTEFQANQEELKIRAAWLYFVEGLTQEQVAERLGMNRIKAWRLLAAARQDGSVQISINTQAEPNIRLQRDLEKHCSLEEAIVVPSSSDMDESVATVVGHATGRYISSHIDNGLTIGVGWGSTFQVSMRSLSWREVKDVTVISLLGGLSHTTLLNPSAAAWRLADVYNTELYQIMAPVFTGDEHLAQLLWAQNDLKELHRKAQEIDLALVSVSDISKNASIFHRKLLTWEEGMSLKEAGAVGDVLCHFVDRNGQVIDHPVNKRVMAINPNELRKIPRVVLSSGSVRKVEAIRAGILATNATTLITDEAAAKALLALDPIVRDSR
ncbi:MAG: sugar-binding transcriptional regulator [Rhizobiaceae bacterium]|nr:sugar-binding transcriptional regulator [Rhizobiaceae bacterium]